MDTIENYEFEGQEIVRRVNRRDGTVSISRISRIASAAGSASESFDYSWLRSATSPLSEGPQETLRVVDLFAGCGGLSVGMKEAARALGLNLEIVMANDIDEVVLETFSINFPEANIVSAPIETLINGQIGFPLTNEEAKLRDQLGNVDIVIGGPPCQGNSALNNHTRHDDPKNELYLVMARFCEIFTPSHVVIENVPGVLSDRRQVAQRTWAHLEALGYDVSSGVVDTSTIGVAQKRKRSVTLASRVVELDVAELISNFSVPVRDVMWAIGDLGGQPEKQDVYNSPATPSPENRKRIDYLFDNDLYNLPDEFRPDCHRLKTHSYKSVYGRIFPTKPAQTITTGFGSMGRGRNVHPNFRRCLTPHEAARVQHFPDFFQFGTEKRTELQKMIGNAVPSKLGYAIGVYLLR